MVIVYHLDAHSQQYLQHWGKLTKEIKYDTPMQNSTKGKMRFLSINKNWILFMYT